MVVVVGFLLSAHVPWVCLHERVRVCERCPCGPMGMLFTQMKSSRKFSEEIKYAYSADIYNKTEQSTPFPPKKLCHSTSSSMFPGLSLSLYVFPVCIWGNRMEHWARKQHRHYTITCQLWPSTASRTAATSVLLCRVRDIFHAGTLTPRLT